VTDAIGPIAAQLCREDVTGIDVIRGGGNNRVYRVLTSTSAYALKSYGPIGPDGRDRLHTEFTALRFLGFAGAGRAVPVAIASDAEARCALYEWIDGVRPEVHGAAEIDALLGLLATMHAARRAEGAAALAEATEATLTLGALLAQIATRLERLDSVTPSEPALQTFLACAKGEFARCEQRLAGRDRIAPLDAARRTLSPSDFGFHNSLRRSDGGMTFLDFEYFGWDDPVKLTADFLWHPAMSLSPAEKLYFLAGATDLYGDHPDFQDRLAVYYPLFGIRWCLIILNEFIPATWERRVFSGTARGEWTTVKRDQLAKAQRFLEAVGAYREGAYV
jgi:hypothetical protein